MSIIERVAERLGPIERQNAKSPALDALDPIERTASGSIERAEPSSETRDFAAQLEAIEQAVRENAEVHEFPDGRKLVAQSEGKSFAGESPIHERSVRRTEKTTNTLKVDRALLRRQSIITPEGERTPNAESFRRVKRQILAKVSKSKTGAPSNLVMVTSALPGEGKTFCAINLAISMALERDRTVLLVDTDVAKPSVPKALGLRAEHGLLDVLLDRGVDLDEVLWRTDIGKLTLLPAGKAHQHATELLASEAMRTLLQEMAERYHDRIVIFDSPPLLVASEAGVLASQMGQIIVVVEAGNTSEATLKVALNRIESSNITGLLLNKGERSRLGEYYGEYG